MIDRASGEPGHPELAVVRRTLGRSGLEITPLGFGAWSIGGAAWAYDGGPDRDVESLAAMHHAFESGVNWVDTAPTYGRGHSEVLVGRAVRQLGSERPLVFTKCGRKWDAPDAKPRSELTPAAIGADCEGSLERLDVEVIDLLQIHWPEAPGGTPIEESWGAMRRLVEEGKIRAAGVCNFDRGLLQRCESVGHVDSLQLPFSMIARESAAGLIQWCAANGTAVLAYSPMQIGLLTDSFSPATLEAMHSEDWRLRHPEFHGPRLERNLDLRDRLRSLASEHRSTVSAIAVAWVLAWKEVTGAIVGASRAPQVDDWLPAGNITLSDVDLSEIAKAIQQSGAGSGPLRPGQLSTTST